MAEPVLTLVKASDVVVGDLFPDEKLIIMQVTKLETFGADDLTTIVIHYQARSGGLAPADARMFLHPYELMMVFRNLA